MTSLVSPPAVETHALEKRFGSRVAVASLDIVVGRGEMFGLVGPDGAGKSTAIRLLCGIVRPTGGSGRVLGLDLATGADDIKARIGYLSQAFTLYGDLTVDENIRFFADLHGVRDFRARREELLDFTRLGPARGRLAQALSGGMKKKLALACTLIHAPELLLLDEPSTGVDPVSRGEFWNILAQAVERGVTVIMTTPYLDEVERCDTVAFMHAGRIIRTGTPAEARRAVVGRVFDIACPNPRAAYAALRAGWPPTSLVLYGDRVHVWTPGDGRAAERAVRMLNDTGLGPASLTQSEPTLEDAFVDVLGGRPAEGDSV
jgi:ABC-2 type transport system ATP-binding protein